MKLFAYVNLLQMTKHTVTYVAITTLHLAFVNFTVDIYSTDAAIWSQTQTTTDWQGHSSGTAFQQMITTNIPEIFTNVASTVHNEFNVSLEYLVSAFNISSYVGNCNDHLYDTLECNFQFIPVRYRISSRADKNGTRNVQKI